MIPAALILAGLGVLAFILAAKSGQFDDLDTPALRAVFDDDDQPISKSTQSVNEDDLEEPKVEHES